MKFTSTLQLLLAATTALAAPSIEERSPSISRSDRVGPKCAFKPLPETAKRNKVCNVKTHGNGQDDSEYVLAALRACNNGGKVVFDKDYTIGTALDIQWLKHIDLGKSFRSYQYVCEAYGNFNGRYHRHNPIHQRHKLLDQQRLPDCLPKLHHLLQTRR